MQELVRSVPLDERWRDENCHVLLEINSNGGCWLVEDALDLGDNCI